uniref:LolSOBPc n=1 Tax=Bichromomyia olmeca TaxID=715919 RepID=A0A1B1V3H3_9DIPT|nr:LolSOBPc [Bichromomyia olmeca]
MNVNFIIFAFFILIEKSSASNNPANYCIKKLAKTEEACIQHCKYRHYGFTNNNFKITKKHIENLRTVLLEFNAVPISQKNQLYDHLKKCADKANALKPKTRREKCYKIITYSRCAYGGKVVSEHKYVKALIEHDKLINV